MRNIESACDSKSEVPIKIHLLQANFIVGHSSPRRIICPIRIGEPVLFCFPPEKLSTQKEMVIFSFCSICRRIVPFLCFHLFFHLCQSRIEVFYRGILRCLRAEQNGHQGKQEKACSFHIENHCDNVIYFSKILNRIKKWEEKNLNRTCCRLRRELVLLHNGAIH